jgi:oligopeptide transport system substrate-binding protein
MCHDNTGRTLVECVLAHGGTNLMRKQAWLRAAAGLTAAALVLTACSQKTNEGTSGSNDSNANQPSAGWPETAVPDLKPGKKGGTFKLAIVEPTAIDPFNAQESEGILVASHLFTGLTTTTYDGKVEPGVATKWETNDDCTEWTFDLMKGTKFHNGEEVTSESFKRGWERVAAKDSASEVAYHMNEVEGFDEMQAGTATSLSGVDASDPAVLKVKLTEPNCAWYVRTSHTVFSPVPSTAGSPTSNPAYVDQPIGNGPFMMDGPWQHNVGIKLKRFDDYKVQDPAYLDSVEISITPNGAADEYAGYQNGQFDWARMPVPVLSQARATYEPKDQWITRNTAGMNYLLVMVTTKPLDSAKARKAISMAIDRNAIINGVFKGSQTPSSSIVPPAFADAYQKGVCDSCEFNLDEAKKLAKEAGLTSGTKVNFQFNTGGGHEEWTAAVADQLKKNLGLDVEPQGLQFKDLLDNEQQPGASGIFRSAWGADYADPANFLEPLLATTSIGAKADEPTTGDNKGRYSNPKFDKLLKDAKKEKDDSKRIALDQQAEKVAIGDDLALIPLWNRTQHRLANSDKFINLRMDFHEDPDLRVISIK